MQYQQLPPMRLNVLRSVRCHHLQLSVDGSCVNAEAAIVHMLSLMARCQNEWNAVPTITPMGLNVAMRLNVAQAMVQNYLFGN